MHDKNIRIHISLNTAVETIPSRHPHTVLQNLPPSVNLSNMTEVQPSSNSNAVARTVVLHDSSTNSTNNNNSNSEEASIAHLPADSQSPPASTVGQSSTGRSPKKRRKVNHGEPPPPFQKASSPRAACVLTVCAA